jgi:hypothetical protein
VAGAMSLDEAVAGLYRVFARYPLREDVSYCDHCVAPEEVEELHRTALREVTPDQLEHLMANYSTWGDPAYHAHFLPRLLEVTASGAISVLMYPIQLPPYLRRVGIEERPALDRFLAAWWQTTLTTWPSRCESQGILKVIDSCGEHIAPYLAA